MRRASIRWVCGLMLAAALSGCTFNWFERLAAIPVRAAADAPVVGDPARGEAIFRQGLGAAPPCITCHALARGGFSLGPPMEGIAERAARRIEGVSAEAYLRQSILEPEAFTAPGFRPIMYPDYGDHFSEQDLADLVAFLMEL